jgi:hypothetical protein
MFVDASVEEAQQQEKLFGALYEAHKKKSERILVTPTKVFSAVVVEHIRSLVKLLSSFVSNPDHSSQEF